MNYVAIKDADSGEYYAGCNKRLASTLLGAQLYRSEKTAKNVINTSINFHIRNPKIVHVILAEVEE